MRPLENIRAALELMIRPISPACRDQKCISLRRRESINRLLHIRPAYFFPIAFHNRGNRRRPQEEFLNRKLIESRCLAKIREQRRQHQARSGIASEYDSFFLVVFGPEKKLYGGRKNLVAHPFMTQGHRELEEIHKFSTFTGSPVIGPGSFLMASLPPQ